MAYSDNAHFWVIFDTCTRPEYYQDVHNLLAMPREAVLRYEYRKKYLSDAAVAAALNPDAAPASILLVYAQWNGYHKGAAAPLADTPSEQMLWIPTRLAEIQLIPPPEGDNFFFDLKVLGYPKLDHETLMTILKPLIDSRTVPYRQWVCIAEDPQCLDALKTGTEDDNWQAIVDRLEESDSQFSGDSFWRLKVPYSVERGNVLKPIYQTAKQRDNGKVQLRKVTSVYSMSEGDRCSLELVSHSPSGLTIPSRRVSLQAAAESPVILQTSHELELRQYTAYDIGLRAKRSDEIEERSGVLTFRTVQAKADWVAGANLDIRFSVAKPIWKVILALALGVAAVVFAAVGGWLIPHKPPIAFALIAVGVLAIVARDLLWAGRLGFRL